MKYCKGSISGTQPTVIAEAHSSYYLPVRFSAPKSISHVITILSFYAIRYLHSVCTKGDHVSLENDTLAISLAHKELFIFGFASNVAREIQNGLTIFTLPHNFKDRIVLWCPIKVIFFHLNESCLSCPHPPLSYERRREQKKISF